MSDDLAGLLNRIEACRLCRDEARGDPLPHEPRPVVRASVTARIVVAGQAPGTRVHATGIPFNDPSGDRLRDWMDVSREEFYDRERIAIVPMGFCFPGLDRKGGDLPPRRECAPAWRASVFEHLAGARLVLTIGQYAQAWHLGRTRKRSLTETVRNWREYAQENLNPMVIPLPHPSWRNNAWLKKNPWFEAEVLPFLRDRVRRLLT